MLTDLKPATVMVHAPSWKQFSELCTSRGQTLSSALRLLVADELFAAKAAEQNLSVQGKRRK